MKPRLLALFGLLLLTPTAPAQAELPKDLALVPAESYGFVHIRAADIVSGKAMEGLRTSILKAGPKALAAIDAQFVPAPSTLDRVTIAAVPGDGPEPMLLFVLSFAKKFDAERVVATYSADPKPTAVGGVKVYRLDDEMALASVEDQILLIGPPVAIGKALAAGKKSPEFAAKLARAGDGKSALFASVSRKSLPLPPDFEDKIPPQFRPLAKMEELTLSAGLADRLSVQIEAKFPGEADAKAAEAVLLGLAKQGRAELAKMREEAGAKLFQPPGKAGRPLKDLPEALGIVWTLSLAEQADEFLNALPLKRAGDTLSATASSAIDGLPAPVMVAMGVGMMLPAVQKVREAAARTQSTNNLKQFGLAMHNFHDVNNKFPAAAIADKAGKPLLSWRVAILPMIDQEKLYNQFKLDEPWDSDHNKKLIPLMPTIYADPRMPPTPGMTPYKVFVGKSAGFLPAAGRTFADFTDGTSNTAMIACGGDVVPWTKPEDFLFDGTTVPDLKSPSDLLLVAFFDGSVRAVRVGPGGVSKAQLKAMITPAGGENEPLP